MIQAKARLFACLACLVLGSAARGFGENASLNLLKENDLSQLSKKGIPVGYKLVAKIPRGTGEEFDASEYVETKDTGGRSASLSLRLPQDRDLWLSQLKPISLEENGCYLLSVTLRWSELTGIGAGIPNFGPCFVAYVYSTSTQKHLMGLIKPSASSEGWVKLEIPLDLAKNPDYKTIRLIFCSRDIEGTVDLKEAVLKKVKPEDLPAVEQFILPDGRTISGAVLKL